MPDESIGLGAFIEAAGSGLSDAQDVLAGTELTSTTMAVSEATLIARVGLEVDAAGAVKVQTLDRKGIASLGTGASSLSTVTLNFVALTDVASPVLGSEPPIGKDKAIDSVALRPDVKRLAEVLGPLTFDATFVPERSAWLVSATDDAGRQVREAFIDGAS